MSKLTNNPTRKLLAAIEFLRTNRLGIFATVHTQSKISEPEAALVYYWTDEQLTTYILTSGDSQKIKNIKDNNQVALVIGTEVVPRVLQIQGTATLVTDPQLKARATDHLAKMATANPDSINWPPLTYLTQKSSIECLAITISSFKYSDFSQNQADIIMGHLSDLKIALRG